MVAWNKTQGKVIAKEVKVAKRLFARLRGLIGTPPLRRGQALWIPKCSAVHTFGMSYPIDVIFLDQRKKVVRLTSGLRPNSLGAISLRSRSVIECPAGTIQKLRIRLGDKVGFSKD